MTRAPLRARRRVPSSSGLTGWRAGEPEPDDEDDTGSICRGIQELPRRREKDYCAGYSSRGMLPVSMWSENGVVAVAGDAPLLAPSFIVEAAAWNDVVDGGEVLLAAALEEHRPQCFAVECIPRLVALLLQHGRSGRGRSSLAVPPLRALAALGRR